MKTKRIAKFLTLALSFAMLIACIVGVAVSASDDASSATAEFKTVTLNYGAETRIAYALSLTSATPEEVVLNLYDNAELAGDPVASAFSGDYYLELYPVYYSYGISAKDLADYVYAVPVLAESGVAIGEACRYSVAQYCNSVLQDPEASSDLVALAGDLLAYGASAQQRLINIGNIEDEALVTEYAYVYTTDASVTVEGSYKSTLLAPGATFVPTYTGADMILGWELRSKDGTVTKTTTEAMAGLTATSATSVEPIFFERVTADFEEGYINDGNMVSYDFDGTAYVKADDTASSLDGKRVNYEVVEDPTGADNKALKISGEGTQESTNAYSEIPVQTVAEGNCYVFESRLYVASQSALANIAFIYFRDSSNNVAFYLNYIYDPSTNDCVLRMVTKNFSNQDVYTTIGTFKPDKWVNMRLELYKSNVAEENCVKLYLGESAAVMKYVGGATACYNQFKYVTNLPITKISCEYFRKNTFNAYFDDVSFTRVNKEYIAEG